MTNDTAAKNKLAAHLWVDSTFTDARLTKEDRAQIAEHLLTVEHGVVDGSVTDKAAGAGARLMTEILVAKKVPAPVVDKHQVVVDYIRKYLSFMNASENALDDLASRVLRQSDPAFNSAGELREHVVTLAVSKMSDQPELAHLFKAYEIIEPTQEQMDVSRREKEKMLCDVPESELLAMPAHKRLAIANAYHQKESTLNKEAQRRNHAAAVEKRMDATTPQWRELQKSGNLGEVLRIYEKCSAEIKAEQKKPGK